MWKRVVDVLAFIDDQARWHWETTGDGHEMSKIYKHGKWTSDRPGSDLHSPRYRQYSKEEKVISTFSEVSDGPGDGTPTLPIDLLSDSRFSSSDITWSSLESADQRLQFPIRHLHKILSHCNINFKTQDLGYTRQLHSNYQNSLNITNNILRVTPNRLK